MEIMKIKSQTQPIENAEVFEIYSDGEKTAVRIVANEGFELVKEGEEPTDIRSVDIPALYEERVNLYKAVLWVEKPEIEEPEPEENDEISATEFMALIEEAL